VSSLFWPLTAWSVWAQEATAVAATKFEGDALVPVFSVCEGSTSQCNGGHDS
jgi:hypothetical protein